MLAKVHLTHRKIMQKKEVLDQIANHTKIDTSLKQTLTFLHLSQSSKNPLFKNQNIYNK